MIRGIDSLHQNVTWNLVKLSHEKESIENRWENVIEWEANGSKWHKTRTVVKGFEQKTSIDFNEISEHAIKKNLIWVVLPWVASMNLELEQLDIKPSFLFGDLDEKNLYV